MPLVLFLEPHVSTISEPLRIQHFVIPANPRHLSTWLPGFMKHPAMLPLAFVSVPLASCIPSICPCRMNLTHHKIPTTLLAFPSITVMFAVKFHTTRPTTFLTVVGLLGLPVLTMHGILVALKLIKQDQGKLHRYHMCTEDHLEICLIVLLCCWFTLNLQHLLSSTVIPPIRTPYCGDLLMDFLQHVDNLAEWELLCHTTICRLLLLLILMCRTKHRALS